MVTVKGISLSCGHANDFSVFVGHLAFSVLICTYTVYSHPHTEYTQEL